MTETGTNYLMYGTGKTQRSTRAYQWAARTAPPSETKLRLLNWTVQPDGVTATATAISYDVWSEAYDYLKGLNIPLIANEADMSFTIAKDLLSERVPGIFESPAR
jgi:hypothetical protein